MASGKKNYFRHSFFARNDTKLRLLRDEIGVGYYFYYFSLLELCGEDSAEELPVFYEFHHSVLRQIWSVRNQKVVRLLSSMTRVGLIFSSSNEKTYQITIPNFSKYLGKYTNKIDPNVPNKRKEKKRKEKKSIIAESSFIFSSKNENQKSGNEDLDPINLTEAEKKANFNEMFNSLDEI